MGIKIQRRREKNKIKDKDKHILSGKENYKDKYKSKDGNNKAIGSKSK